MKLRTKALFVLMAVSVSGLTSIESALTAESLSGVSVTLMSPKPGSTVNPDLPLTLTLQLKGGPAATANKCDQDSLSAFEFGAQVIDANNRAKSMRWGIENVAGYGTGNFLYGWSAKIIPGGIECTTVTGMPRRVTSPFAYFGEGFNENDVGWFNTEQTIWSGDITNFETPKRLDIAWNLSGTLQHTVFVTTTKGSPMVEISGLTRGQTIDYEAVFQISTNFASSETLQYFGATADSVREEEFLKCDDKNSGTKQVNGDGTVTYTKFCLIDFRTTDRGEESLIITPYVYTGTLNTSGQAVAINVGKQGIPPCEIASEQNSSQLGSILSKFKSLEANFAKAISGAEGKKVLEALQTLNSDANSLSTKNSSLTIEVTSCSSTQEAIETNLNSFLSASKSLSTKVQKFVSSPSLQAKALAESKARAKKAAADKANYAKSMYSYGFNFVAKLSVNQLNDLSIWKFPSPGRSSLTDAQARDWCSQLPRVVPGLSNVVGYPANSNYVAGCAEAAKKVRF